MSFIQARWLLTLATARQASQWSPLSLRMLMGPSMAPCLASASAQDPSMASGVDVEVSNGHRLHFRWSDSVSSTQDEMRTFLTSKEYGALKDKYDVVAQAASAQVKGRGTSGRKWLGLDGNLFLTVAIPSSDMPFPITLLPLRIGVIIAEELKKALPAAADRVSLKWPNDVLIGGKKVSGLLIELTDPNIFLVGIGINVRKTPKVPHDGADRGRPATCLYEHGMPVTHETVYDMSLSLAQSLTTWYTQRHQDTAGKVRSDWSVLTEWGQEFQQRNDGTSVVPLELGEDGSLRVRVVDTGATKHLVADYLY